MRFIKPFGIRKRNGLFACASATRVRTGTDRSDELVYGRNFGCNLSPKIWLSS